MLTHLSIQNFTLVDSLEIEFRPGMTVITGETGAGKSLVVNALALTLGDRADAERVRQGARRADICATFDIGRVPAAHQWLREHDLDSREPGICDEVILRRAVTREGRSRGYINGQPVPLSQLRELGELLLELHSQHAHQSLLKKDTHLQLLDQFAQQQALTDRCHNQFRTWQKQRLQYQTYRDSAEEISARVQLLRYQVQELDALGLGDAELQALEDEQSRLANAEQTLQSCHSVMQLCDGEDAGALASLSRALQTLEGMDYRPARLQGIADLLSSAEIQLQEARTELSHYIDHFELDPQRLQEVEVRLSSIYNIARKHRVNAAKLTELHRALSTELASLDGSEATLDDLQLQVERSREDYLKSARKLSEQRCRAAKRFAAGVNEKLQELAMQNARFEIACHSDIEKPTGHGIDNLEFLICTNPGQPARPLAKIASGGELSRISLAIQVVAACNSTLPSLVFDEVDVGIGGATADVVGRLLRKLSKSAQVICVTHLPQVASKGSQHLRAHKQSKRKSAQSTLSELSGHHKTEEIARMLGGSEITDQTLAHAREMLELAVQ